MLKAFLQNLLRILFLPLVHLLRLRPVSVPLQDDKNPDALKILFIGNSLTYTNQLPLVLCKLFESGKETIGPRLAVSNGFRFYMVIQAGMRLEDHWRQKLALRLLIEEGPWDYVVIQEQSLTSLQKKGLKYARLLVDAIKKAGSRPVLFAIWSYEGDDEACQTVNSYMNEMAGQLDIIKVPVGECWSNVCKEHPQIRLYTDAIHPSPAGTYLAACAFYAVLARTSPVGLPACLKTSQSEIVLELSEDEARILQNAAAKTCL